MTLHRPRSPFLAPILAPTLVLTLGLGLMAGCGSDDATPVASDPLQSTPTSADAAPEATPAEPERSEPTESAGTGSETVAAPIYFVGDSPTGPRLYREFRQVEADNPLMEGAALLLGGDVLDPDYYTLLPSLDIISIETVDGAIEVSLGSDSPTSDKSSSPKLSRIAVQSLVYTLQGIAQSREPVRVVMGDQPVTLLGQPTDTGVAARDPLKVLALVSVTDPASGAETSGTLTASGVASSFEATVLWEIRDADGAVVLDGFATAEGFMDRLYPWETDIDISSLAAGSYTFAALTSDPSAGEGPGPYEDTKMIAVG